MMGSFEIWDRHWVIRSHLRCHSKHFRIGDLISIDFIPFRRCWFQITYTYSILFLFLCVRDVKLPPTFCSGYLAIYRYPILFCCRTCRYRWMVKNSPAMVVWLCSWAERSTGNENTKGSRIWICRRARTLWVNTCKHEMLSLWAFLKCEYMRILKHTKTSTASTTVNICKDL